MVNGHLINYTACVKLDNKDKKILDLIIKNARMPISEISRKTGIPRDSVMYRIEKMQKQKVIRYYHALLDPSVLGYPIYSFITFNLYNLDQESEQKFIAFLNAHDQVVYVAKTTGKWDFTICLAAKNLKDFDGIITEIKMKFSKIIKEYESASIIQEYKFDAMSGLIK